MLGLLKKKMNLTFFWLNIIGVVTFTFLYKLQDGFIVRNKEFALKYGLLSDDYDSHDYSNRSSSFMYYLWYSLITQTTVGYSGAVDSKTGLPVSFIESPNRVFKVLNIAQLLSVLFIVSVV
jgi:hypothetical protein